MIRTIIFATDLGVFTSHVLQHVITLANSCAAKVVVVHAVEPLGCFANAVVKTYLLEESGEAFAAAGVERMMFSIKSRIRDLLAAEYMEGKGDFNCISDIRVVQGVPAKVILRESREQQADLIVMGSHGPNAMGGHMLGSVTNRVLQCTKIPVYMVPMMHPFYLYNREEDKQIRLW